MKPRRRFYICLNLQEGQKAVWPLLFRSSDEATRYGVEHRVFRDPLFPPPAYPETLPDGRQILSWSVECSA